jgi:hypothetical protein
MQVALDGRVVNSDLTAEEKTLVELESDSAGVLTQMYRLRRACAEFTCLLNGSVHFVVLNHSIYDVGERSEGFIEHKRCIGLVVSVEDVSGDDNSLDSRVGRACGQDDC